MCAASRSGYTLRPLSSADGARLAAINRRCPIMADFTFYFDRGADFFAWPRQAFESYRYLGVFFQQELVGYGMAGFFRGGQGGKLQPQAYFGDWRVLPDHRGKRLAEWIGEALADEFPAELTCTYCLAKEGNHSAERVIDLAYSPGWRFRPLCDFTSYNLLFLLRPAPPRRYRVRRATPADAPQLARLCQQAWQGRLFAPRPDAAELEADLRQLQQGGQGAYYLAERNGQPVGALRAWDSEALHKTVVLGYSASGQLLRVAAKTARLVLRNMAPLPRPGQAFRALTLHRLAIPDNDPRVLRDLLLAVLRDHQGQGFHMAHLGLCDGDQLVQALRGLPAQRFRSQITMIYRGDYDLSAAALSSVPWIDLQRI